MTGKNIDRCVLTVIFAAAFYLFFLNAWGSIPLACILSFMGCIILRRLFSKRPVRCKCTRLQAEAELMCIAQMPDENAHTAIERILRKRYPDELFTLAPAIKHPSQCLGVADVFAQWKKHRDEDRLLIACTCTADSRAVMYARELSSPPVAIVDKRHLLHIIQATGIEFSARNKDTLWARLKRIPLRFTLPRTGVKNALFGIAFIILYLLAGNPVYLFAGLGSLFLFGCTLPGKRYKKHLF